MTSDFWDCAECAVQFEWRVDNIGRSSIADRLVLLVEQVELHNKVHK